ncbi:hypothetical protein SDC9_167693 [bioreactor metagenome]|uniref:Uncharacterized protein n=1 Tax=bioreactor metagenome TaxID=1076179 RepID=A0A645G0Z8_9ZZZZ
MGTIPIHDEYTTPILFADEAMLHKKICTLGGKTQEFFSFDI